MVIMKISKLKILLVIVILILSNISILTIQGKVIKKIEKKDNQIQTIEASFDLLIIAPEEFSKPLIPLVNHKNKYEVKTKLVTTEEVYQQIFWEGKDKAEKIKLFIKEAKEKWEIQYVLLVGGRKDQRRTETWWIPARYTYLNRKYGQIPEPRFLTDLYFADIYDSEGNFSSWDNDNDGIFGEWPENSSAVDIPDLYPDVYVGRLPCRNKFDVKIIVNKIIKYETGKFDDSWFKKMVVVAGDTYPNKTEYYDGEVYTQNALDMMEDFEPVKLWASEGSLKHGFNIVRAINKGCGFVFFSGHGNAATWVTHPPDDIDKRVGYFQLIHIKFLRNRKKLPIGIAGSGCFVSMFNVSLSHSHLLYWRGLFKYNIPRCWSWALTREINGGCIGVIGSTGLSYESPDITRGEGGCEWLDIHFFEQYRQKGTDILGKCWGDTITGFLQNFTINWSDPTATGDALIAKNCEQWLLIGDPSLKIGGYT